ncbi:PAS domain S-box protein [Carboxylicivirga sp. M1479]|uniref:PAS domain-containing sensor histidine kinase n=1 Tax=Carboxylicivirga sp. M1479 TaxID=2594476 RepID=UPI0011781B36|nr:PAS domain S-box protein [Carboxylicivirga sp. M1479]TRX70785.1 PAS domain S-box protein [Carboxylicivirga sp. M1479]
MEIRDELIKALDYSESIVILTDERGMIRYVNKTFVDKYGYSEAEVMGKNPRLLRSDYHDDVFYSHLWSTIRNGETWRGVFKNISKTGQVIWEKAIISPVNNANNVLTGYIAVKEDVTHQRELELKLDRDAHFLDNLFDNSPVGIAILQPIYNKYDIVSNYRIIRANPSAGTVVGRLGIVGLSLSDVLPSEQMESERLNLMLTRKSSFESHLDASGKFVRYRSFPFGEDNVCLFFYDVTPYRQTIEALEASEERYFSLVEDAPALISRFDKDGVLIYANEQYCRTFETDNSELIGKSIFDWYSPDDRERAMQIINGLSVENPISVVEHPIILKNGTKKWMRWLDRALVDSSGSIFEYQSVGMDLTPLKQSETELLEHRNKLDAVINSTVAGIGVVSPKGSFVLVNERFRRMLGFDGKDDMYSCSYLDITHPMWHHESELKFTQLLAGEIKDYNLECQFSKKDGTSFWGDLHVSPIKDVDGHIIEIIGIVTDIDSKKEIELKLKEREVKLKELNATKDKLFSIIAHDIKNPFNSILGFTSLLKNNLDYYTKEEIKEYVDQIALSSENVYKLLDDLLVWAKSQLGQMKVSPQFFRVKTIIDSAFDNFGVLAQNKGIHLVSDVDQQIVMYADLDMLKFVVRNLIHNAIKFTQANGEIRCSSWEEGAYIVLSVRDTGIGIKASKLDSLFEITSYLTTTGTAEEKGTGLGLHLSKDMLNKNKGRIEVKSEVGKGTEFLLYLPMNENSAN